MDKNIKIAPGHRSVKDFLKSSSFRKAIISIIAGGLAGFLFFWFIGCKSGTCAITSNPYSSIAMGSILAFLLTGSNDSRGKA